MEHIRKTTEIEVRAKKKKILILELISGLVLITILYLITNNWLISISGCAGLGLLIKIYLVVRVKLKEAADIEKMESVFPDFIQLMSSNLRAGITIDRALLLSSRKEFAPLDKEIILLGKDIITGKEINQAMMDMAKRIKSDKITKTIELITTGIKSGGNLSVLLDQTAANMRERLFVEKRAASNVLMYVIFIFFAVAVGAPGLFGLSSVMVEILKSILATVPTSDTPSSFGLSLTSISISSEFIFWFSFTFLIVTDVLASLVLGLVGKGEERAGAKYIIPLTLISLAVFLTIRIVLKGYFTQLFA